MSSLTPTTSDIPQQKTEPAAVEDIQALRDQLKKLLAKPDLLPDNFLSFLVDYLSVNQPAIPISQIFGFSQFTAQGSEVAAQESTTSDIATDLTTTGPALSNLGPGNYVVLWGANLLNVTAGKDAVMSLSVTGGTSPSDTVIAGSTASFISGARAALIALTGETNSITAKYKRGGTGGTATFYGRWLIAIRYANI